MVRPRLVAPLLLALVVLSACGGAAPSSPAAAPAAHPARASAPEPAASPQALQTVRGSVASVTGDRLELTGGHTLTLSKTTHITRLIPIGATGLRAGQYVAITAKPQSDGTLLASVVNVFPAASRGTGAGQRPMGGGDLMTNATIQQVKGSSFTGFTVTFPGGGAHVKLGPDAQVNRMQAGSVSAITPGERITAFVSPKGIPFVVFVQG